MNILVAPEFRPNNRLLKAFIWWIEQPCFDSRFARKWGQLSCQNLEAAVCEATFWDVLSGFGVVVRPNDLGDCRAAPDFLCFKNGTKFYVEVTCITLETAKQRTNLEPFSGGETKARHYATLNLAIASECREKTPQCANLDAPCLLGIGPFHFEASAHVINKDCIGHLLTDEPQIGVAFDPFAGRGVGDPYQFTDFRRPSFTRIVDGSLQDIRQPISGLTVGGFGVQDPPLFGVLHPNARRPFNPALLSQIPFCRLQIDPLLNTASAEWESATSRG